MIDSVGFWVAADAWPSLRAARLAPDELRALARRRLARVLRGAAETVFNRRRFDAAGFGGDSRMLDSRPEQVLGALAPAGKAELRAAGRDVLAGGRVRPD